MISILSIGTELTTGQISNGNAQWLSKELLKLGMSVSYHITVPDDNQLIDESLKYLTEKSTLLFITGGLGPTSDDFTRKVICKSFAIPLLWNEENWNKVQQKLSSRKVQIRELHRQQCEFPQGSVILDNSTGIADGFTFTISQLNLNTNQNQNQKQNQTQKENINPNQNITEIYCLPGPPREISSIWFEQILPRLSSRVPDELRWVQTIWTTTGVPESEVASKINAQLQSHGDKVLYRAYSPKVDVKLLYQKKDAVFYEELGIIIQETLKPWLCTDGDQ